MLPAIPSGPIILHKPGNKPDVDQDTIEIWSTKGEEVEWACDHPGQEFYVCFRDKSTATGSIPPSS